MNIVKIHRNSFPRETPSSPLKVTTHARETVLQEPPLARAAAGRGVLSYVLVVCLGAIEFVVRQKVKRAQRSNQTTLVCLVACAVLLVSIMYPSAASAEAVPESFQQLMKTLGKEPRLRKGFVQERYVPGLKSPLRSEGVFTYEKDSYVEWHTCAPVVHRVKITKHGVQGAGHDSESSTVRQERMARFILALFSGDVAEVRRTFAVSFSGEADTFTATLEPHSLFVAEVIRRVTLAGKQFPEKLSLDFEGEDRVDIHFIVPQDVHCTPGE